MSHKPPAAPALGAPLDAAGRALLFTEARTVRRFADTPVGDAQLQSIAELTRWPPTSGNTSPLRILFVRSAAGRERLLALLSERNRERARSAPVTAVLATDLDFHEQLGTLFPVFPGARDEFAARGPAPRERVARFNATLQIGYFILAVRSVGLAAGPMEGFDAAGVDAAFFADCAWRSLLVVNIGHPGVDPWHPRLPRLEAEAFVRWA